LGSRRNFFWPLWDAEYTSWKVPGGVPSVIVNNVEYLKENLLSVLWSGESPGLLPLGAQCLFSEITVFEIKIEIGEQIV